MRAHILILAIAVSGCTPQVVPSAQDFASTVRGHPAGPPQRCIALKTGDSLRAIDSMTLAYGSGPTFYVNRLGARCPGLQELSTIIVDGEASHYCRGDRIRAIEPDSIIAGPTCNLGEWVAYKAF